MLYSNFLNSVGDLCFQAAQCLSSGVAAVGFYMNRLYTLICCRDLNPDDVAARVNDFAIDNISQLSSIDEDKEWINDIFGLKATTSSHSKVNPQKTSSVITKKNNLEPLDNKISRVKAALAVFSNSSFDSYPLIAKASHQDRAEALTYLEVLLERLEQGDDVSIPEWYHGCTKKKGLRFLNAGSLHTKAPDYGVIDHHLIHFSTVFDDSPQMDSTFFSFGCGPEVLENMGGDYAAADTTALNGHLQPSVWLQCYDVNDKSNQLFIPITEFSIIGAEVSIIKDVMNKELLNKVNIVSHGALRCIQNAFEEANVLFNKARILPNNWKQNFTQIDPGTPVMPLPPNLPKKMGSSLKLSSLSYIAPSDSLSASNIFENTDL